MKYSCLILPLLCLCFCTYAKKKTDLHQKNLQGPVICLTETTFASPKLVHWGCILRIPPAPGTVPTHTSSHTDSLGRQDRLSYYNADNRLLKTTYYIYNSSNQVTQLIQRSADDGLINKMVYTYNSAGYPSRVDYYNEKDSLYYPVDLTPQYPDGKTDYTFNDTGAITEIEVYDTEGGLMKGILHPHINEEETPPEVIYNYKGQKAAVNTFYPNGGINTRTGYDYDKDGAVRNSYVTRFDTAGNEVSRISYDASGSITSATYTYYTEYDNHHNWHTSVQWTITDNFEHMYPTLYIINRDITYQH